MPFSPTTIEGAPSIRIEAERIDQIAHGNEVELYNVRVNYDAPSGQNWVLFGDTAHVQPGGNIVDVTGNVRLQGENPDTEGTAVIHTDTMSYDVPEAPATTKSDVRIDYGGHIFTARGLIANLKERTVRLESKVNGRFLRKSLAWAALFAPLARRTPPPPRSRAIASCRYCSMRNPPTSTCAPTPRSSTKFASRREQCR